MLTFDFHGHAEHTQTHSRSGRGNDSRNSGGDTACAERSGKTTPKQKWKQTLVAGHTGQPEAESARGDEPTLGSVSPRRGVGWSFCRRGNRGTVRGEWQDPELHRNPWARSDEDPPQSNPCQASLSPLRCWASTLQNAMSVFEDLKV